MFLLTLLAVFTCTVVAELEVSDRSLAQMRRDFLPYFADPALQAVIGIKFCGPGKERVLTPRLAMIVC
jgi:hypothetical protein